MHLVNQVEAYVSEMLCTEQILPEKGWVILVPPSSDFIQNLQGAQLEIGPTPND